MKNLNFLKKLKLFSFHKLSQKQIQENLKKLGMEIGDKCRIFSNIEGPESYLIKLGNNVTIATGARLITHDNSISKPLPQYSDLFGKIEIEDNCFIGAYAIILPGVKISKNTIIAAGAIITKSIENEGEIWGGVPARRIGNVKEFAKKWEDYAINIHGLSYEEKKEYLLHTNKLIKR